MKKTTAQFVEEARSVHGEKYDYSKSNYVAANKAVLIVCPQHGEFSQRPAAHTGLRQGCPKCGKANRKPLNKTTAEFIAEAMNKWGELYEYSQTQYVNKETKITYTCKKHGKVSQKPALHLKSGCPFCNGRGIAKYSSTEFILRAQQVHGDRYDYSRVSLNSISDKITIICPTHGEFTQKAANHINLKNGCPQCKGGVVRVLCHRPTIDCNMELFEFVSNHCVAIYSKGFVFIPIFGLGITIADETRTLPWKLIQIFEQEWLHKRAVIESRILNILQRSERVFARKCRIDAISQTQSNDFFEKTHLQGGFKSQFNLALIREDRLVACMSFNQSRFGSKFKYELTRYSSDLCTTVIGGGSRLLKEFRKKQAGSIVSYADRRWSNGSFYRKLGFAFDGNTSRGVQYRQDSTGRVMSWMSVQKHRLAHLPNFDPAMTADEILRLNGIHKIWTAGNSRWVLR